MQNNSGLVQGCFVKEKNNRFLCDVRIDGAVEECYVPSSCHLSRFLNLCGETVLLKCNASKNARTKYSLYAVVKGGYVIPLELAISNRVVETEINRKLFYNLGKRHHIKREATVNGYKCDLLIEDTNTIIEIKSILTLGRSAVFPSVKSDRSIKQLQELHDLLTDGYTVFYYFVSLSPTVTRVRINRDYCDFYAAFQKCVEAGMRADAFSIRMIDGQLKIYKRLALLMD